MVFEKFIGVIISENKNWKVQIKGCSYKKYISSKLDNEYDATGELPELSIIHKDVVMT